MAPDSNRSLLFGILALQMNFISREQLVAATSQWMMDKSRLLEEILTEQDALSEHDRQLLAPLVARHVENHDGNAEQSLAALNTIGSLGDDLRSLGDPQIDATLMRVAAASERSRAVDPHADTLMPGLGESGSSGDSRYRILRPHAKGGLGELFVAQDAEINREVAVKQIQSQFASDPASRSRFVIEAEVTGGLEHPGIVPVYGLGQHDDGRPYYAMRFIRGDSLKEAIDRFHSENTTDEGQRSLQLRQLLDRFLDVCNAIQYAHSRGVLHRDLKPDNIMLGKYGETLVVDWGLAKLQGCDDVTRVEGETTLYPGAASGSAATQMGSTIGTPAYMSPEQASGDLEQLSPASDVYSLGATLYHLLTGQPPLTSRNIGELLRDVQHGKFPTPRDVRADTPKPLEAICLRAMAFNPLDRYASPKELANDLERYLADAPVTAYVDPLRVRAARWIRKHQVLTATTVAVVFVSAVGLSTFSAVVSGKNTELARLNRQETRARELAEENERAARQQSQLAFSTLTSVVDDIQGGLKNVPGGGEVRRRVLRTSLAKLQQVATEYVEQTAIDHQTFWALIDMGDVVIQFGTDGLPNSDAATPPDAPSAERASAVRLAQTFYRRAHRIAEQLVENDPIDTQARRDLSVSHNKAGDVQLQSGDVAAALAAYEQGLEITLQLAADNPGSPQAQRRLSLSHIKVGNALLHAGDSARALANYDKSLEIRSQLAADDQGNAQARRDLSLSHIKVGDVQFQAGDSAAAQANYEKSLEISIQLAAVDPHDAQAQRDLSLSYNKVGNAELQSGDSAAALANYESSLKVSLQLATDDQNNARAQRDLSVSYDRVADVQLRAGDLAAALANYEKGLAIGLELAAADPHNAEAQRDLTVSYDRIGDVQFQAGDSTAALTSYEESLRIRLQLAADDRGSAQARRDLSISYDRVGDVHLQSGDLPAALAAYDKGLEISRQLAADDPDNARAQRDLSISCDKVGDVQFQSGDADAALANYKKSLEISRQLAADDPGNAQAQRDLSVSYGKVGDVQLQSGDADAALDNYQKSLEISRQLATDDQHSARDQRDLSVSHIKVGDVQLKSGAADAALDNYQKSLEISLQLVADDQGSARDQRDLSVSYERVGDAELSTGDATAALNSYDKSLGIRLQLAANDQNNAEVQRDVMVSHYKLGTIHDASGDYAAAAERYDAGTAVLRQMLAKNMNVEASTAELAILEAAAATARRAHIALGDWDDLLQNPAESIPALLELRALKFSEQAGFEDAARAALMLRDSPQADADQLYNAACVLCRCAASLGQTDSEDQVRQRQTWIDEALVALKKSVAAGYDSFAHMQTDTDLAILRDLPEFRALIPQPKPGKSD